MKKLLVGLLALGSLSSLGQESTERLRYLDCGIDNPLISHGEVISPSESSESTCQRLRQISDILKDVSMFFEQSLRTPVTLLYSVPGKDIGFYTGPQWIFLSQNITKGFRKLNDFDYGTIVAHEYGHHFFFNQFFKEYWDKSFMEGRKKLIPLLWEVDKLKAEFRSLPQEERESRKEEGEKKYSELTKRINEILDTMRESELLARINNVKGYSEFYADLVSVLYRNDLQAMARTQGDNGQSLPEEYSQERDFSLEHALVGCSETRIHGQFAPTRSFIGKYLKNKKLSIDEKKELLRSVYIAISNQYKLFSSDKDSEALNRGLIEEIKLLLNL